MSLRMWSDTQGNTIEGEYVSTIGGKVVIKTVRDQMVRVPCENLIPADREFIELTNPPEFNVDFRAQSRQRQIRSRTGTSEVPKVLQWEFGARVFPTGPKATRY